MKIRKFVKKLISKSSSIDDLIDLFKETIVYLEHFKTTKEYESKCIELSKLQSTRHFDKDMEEKLLSDISTLWIKLNTAEKKVEEDWINTMQNSVIDKPIVELTPVIKEPVNLLTITDLDIAESFRNYRELRQRHNLPVSKVKDEDNEEEFKNNDSKVMECLDEQDNNESIPEFLNDVSFDIPITSIKIRTPSAFDEVTFSPEIDDLYNSMNSSPVDDITYEDLYNLRRVR